MENTLSTPDGRFWEVSIGATRQFESGAEHVFDRITRIASRLKMPIAVVTSHVKARLHGRAHNANNTYLRRSLGGSHRINERADNHPLIRSSRSSSWLCSNWKCNGRPIRLGPSKEGANCFWQPSKGFAGATPSRLQRASARRNRRRHRNRSGACKPPRRPEPEPQHRALNGAAHREGVRQTRRLARRRPCAASRRRSTACQHLNHPAATNAIHGYGRMR